MIHFRRRVRVNVSKLSFSLWSIAKTAEMIDSRYTRCNMKDERTSPRASISTLMVLEGVEVHFGRTGVAKLPNIWPTF